MRTKQRPTQSCVDDYMGNELPVTLVITDTTSVMTTTDQDCVIPTRSPSSNSIASTTSHNNNNNDKDVPNAEQTYPQSPPQLDKMGVTPPPPQFINFDDLPFDEDMRDETSRELHESSESTAPSPSLSIAKSDGTAVELEYHGEVEGRYVCRMCGREFRFEKNLLRHMHKSHSMGDDESVLKCKLCNYTTKHYSNMYVHIRTHTGDKPYWCNACGASFTQGSSLKLHIKSRHDDNMSFFSLNKKLGKNNLTKLWQRVLKKDLGNLGSLDINSGMVPPLSTQQHNRLPPHQNGSTAGSGGMFPTFHPHFNPFQAAAAAAVGLNPFHPLLANPFGNIAPNKTNMPPSNIISNGQQQSLPTLQMCPLDLKLKREVDPQQPSRQQLHDLVRQQLQQQQTINGGVLVQSSMQQSQPISGNVQVPSSMHQQSQPINSGVLIPSGMHQQSQPIKNGTPIIPPNIQPLIKQEVSSPPPLHPISWSHSPVQSVKSSKAQQTEKQISLQEMYLTEENLRIRSQLETLRENARKLLLAIYPNAQRELVGPRVDDILAETVRTAIPAVDKS